MWSLCFMAHECVTLELAVCIQSSSTSRILNTNLINQSIFKESSRLIFQNLFGRYQHLVEKYYVPGFVTRLTRRVSRAEQELRTLPGHLSSPPVFSGVRVTRSLVLYVCFVDSCLYFFFWPLCCLFFFDIQILITPLVSSNSSCPFVLFLLLIVLSVLLRYTDSDCLPLVSSNSSSIGCVASTRRLQNNR